MPPHNQTTQGIVAWLDMMRREAWFLSTGGAHQKIVSVYAKWGMHACLVLYMPAAVIVIGSGSECPKKDTIRNGPFFKIHIETMRTRFSKLGDTAVANKRSFFPKGGR